MSSRCPWISFWTGANHKSRMRDFGGVTLEVHDIPYGERNIWGVTAGMLLTLRRLLQARATVPRTPGSSGAPSG